jgi:hypothetical protein
MEKKHALDNRILSFFGTFTCLRSGSHSKREKLTATQASGLYDLSENGTGEYFLNFTFDSHRLLNIFCCLRTLLMIFEIYKATLRRCLAACKSLQTEGKQNANVAFPRLRAEHICTDFVLSFTSS